MATTVFESLALSLITPPNFGGGGGSWFPGIVVVALGEPNTPVTTCAAAGTMASPAAIRNVATFVTPNAPAFHFMGGTPLQTW